MLAGGKKKGKALNTLRKIDAAVLVTFSFMNFKPSTSKVIDMHFSVNY